MILLLCIFTVFIPIDSWQNEILEELQVRGYRFTIFPSMRPYDSRIAEDLLVGDTRSQCSFHNLSSAFVLEDTFTVLRLKPAILYDWSGFSICLQPVVKFGMDSLPPNNEFMDVFSADYERAYIKYTSTHFDAFVGRERFSSGPSLRNNLILSGYSAPMDWLGYAFTAPKLKLSFFITRLDDMYAKTIAYVGDTVTTFVNSQRYLTIKRFDITPCTWLNIGISEAALFGGENYALEVFQFNPVVFVQAYQYNWDKEANFLLQFDGKIFLKNAAVYGALLIDDFQLEQDPNNEPHHFGINIGVELADPFNVRGIFWVTEYTAVSRYTYCHFFPYQRYLYRETSIGAPQGPDHDELFTKVVYHLSPHLDVYTAFSLLRKGETSFLTLWPVPENPRVEGMMFPGDNFLSGVVEKTLTGQLGVRLFYRQWMSAGLSIGINHITEALHQPDSTKDIFFLNVYFNVGAL
jgi:hypothetical protein